MPASCISATVMSFSNQMSGFGLRVYIITVALSTNTLKEKLPLFVPNLYFDVSGMVIAVSRHFLFLRNPTNYILPHAHSSVIGAEIKCEHRLQKHPITSFLEMRIL